MEGLPVEINPSTGQGFRIMTVEEWSARWKRNDDFPECLNCGSHSTKEHYFTQTWCRGKKVWESETLCQDCHHFSFRSYKDPDFKTPEQYEKERWTQLVAAQRA
jgi:5-methylcytosine-specific restriction endonuclease McrA